MFTSTPITDRMTSLDRHFADRQRMWAGGWRRYVFPGLWLVYLGQTADGVHNHSHGFAAVMGYLILAGFIACYLFGFPQAWMGHVRRFWTLYLISYVLLVAETFFAHADAFVFCTYLAVMTVAGIRRYAIPIIVSLVVVTVFVPPLVPSWHEGVQWVSGLSPLLVGFAMYGFFSIIQANIQLTAARQEVARLAAENERSRIARDLHDLLGHSLTTITVKASLARRLAELGEIDRAAAEIASVEELSRRSLADVRAAVSGYTDVTLTGELASSREVLRAAGIAAEFPGAVDIVEPYLHELFGWVVREGVTNVVRHARASRCTIAVGPTWVEIVDNGQGNSNAACGNGLTGLRDRVAAMGGKLESAGSASGWRLRVDITSATPSAASPSVAAVV